MLLLIFLEVGDNSDTLIGNLGDDTLYGESGDDTLFMGAGNDYLHGGNGSDTADFSDAKKKVEKGITVNLSITGAQAVGGNLGSDTS